MLKQASEKPRRKLLKSARYLFGSENHTIELSEINENYLYIAATVNIFTIVSDLC